MSRYVSAVTAGTLWSDPSRVREVDAKGISNPVFTAGWISDMTVEERNKLCLEDRVETQILYGEEVEVDEIRGEWARVRAVHQPYRERTDGYPGWIPAVQLAEVQGVEEIGYVRVKEARTQLFTKTGLPVLVLSFNTILPVVEEKEAYYIVAAPHGEARLLKSAVDFAQTYDGFPKKAATEMAHEMLRFLDLPYFWGGMSSYGYDCSGLTYNAMKAGGYRVPRNASDQARSGQEINNADRNLWVIGDLIFFTSPGKDRVRHVGIYLGNNTLLHTSISSNRLEVINLQGHLLDKEITHVRRYI